jgi:hypothetical protein
MEATKLQQQSETKITSFRSYNAESKKRPTNYYSDSGVFHECPEGYMTGEEFVKSAKERITKYYSDSGVLHERPEGYLTGEEFFGKIRKNINKFYKERGILFIV